MPIGRQTDRQTDRPMIKHIGGMEEVIPLLADTGRRTDRRTYTDRQTDGRSHLSEGRKKWLGKRYHSLLTHRQTDRQADRQTDRRMEDLTCLRGGRSDWGSGTTPCRQTQTDRQTISPIWGKEEVIPLLADRQTDRRTDRRSYPSEGRKKWYHTMPIDR